MRECVYMYVYFNELFKLGLKRNSWMMCTRKYRLIGNSLV